MKEQKLYICEYCGTSYKDKLKCKECEKGHKQVVKIENCNYTSINSDKTGYPSRINVTMNDGKTVTYKRY